MNTTRKRVAKRTHESIDARIEREIEDRIVYYAKHPGEIGQRLRELDKEWDMERVLEVNAAVLGFAGVLAGRFLHRRFLFLPAAVTGLLAQHAVQGWCPPLILFRRLGVRTVEEIETERMALKVLRGDLDKPVMNGDRFKGGKAPRRSVLHQLVGAIRK